MERKISFKEWVTVFFGGLWQGMTKVFNWVFDYKHKTPFWRVIMAVLTACVVVFTFLVFLTVYEDSGPWFTKSEKAISLKDITEEDVWSDNLNTCYYYNTRFSNRHFIAERKTNRHVADSIQWMQGRDSIYVVAQNRKRGYFNVNNGKWVVTPKEYTHAWIFSEGIAAVEKDFRMYFIGTDGRLLMGGKSFPYNENRNYDTFHRGFFAVQGEDGKWGVIDRNGDWKIEPTYDDIHRMDRLSYIVKKNGKYGAFNDTLSLILPLIYEEVQAKNDSTFLATSADHSVRLFAYDGRLLSDCVFDEVRFMEYDTGEMATIIDEKGTEYETREEVPIKKLANCRRYMTADGWCGLMSMDGHPITPPLYDWIEAIDRNLYSARLYCCYNDENILIDGKGNVVK